MELDALRLEPEPAEVEDTADRALDILDDILMMNAKDLSGAMRIVEGSARSMGLEVVEG